MKLQAIMGDAYKDDITLEEVAAFFEANEKIVLSNGDYVSKSKFDSVNTELKSLKESTKDYETIKQEHANLIEEKTKSGYIDTIKKHVKPEFTDYVYYQMQKDNKLDDKLEDSLKVYAETNKQYAIGTQDNKIISNTIKLDGQTPPNSGNPNEEMNSFIRDSIKK